MRVIAALGLVAALVSGTATGSTRSSSPPPAQQFRVVIERIDAATRERMAGVSWHRGCPTPISHLRLLQVRHWGFNGQPRMGTLIVNRDAVGPMVRAMRRLFELHFPIRRMRPVDVYGADDHRSMADDNTSAFNCRFIAGKPGTWSEHAYGRAIDVNPIENPYVTASGYVSPPAGAPYADRTSNAAGLIHPHSKAVAAFVEAGWKWGGKWSWPKDYQHFSLSGH